MINKIGHLITSEYNSMSFRLEIRMLRETRSMANCNGSWGHEPNIN